MLDVLDDVPDALPADVRERRHLVSRTDALRGIHTPDSMAEVETAKRRLRYEEAFVLQVTLAQRRRTASGQSTTPRPARAGGLLEAFDARLPFTLTAGQREVAATIADEMGRDVPMHRLLQGEVGSGKTVVALRAMLAAVDAGGQAALLAPTEVLAGQHHRTITRCSETSPRAACWAAPSTAPGWPCSPGASRPPSAAAPCSTSSPVTPASSSAPTRCCRRTSTSSTWRWSSSTSSTASASSSATPCAARAPCRRTCSS